MADEKVKEHVYLILNTDYGDVGFIWGVQQKSRRLKEIILPRDDIETTKRIEELWPGSNRVTDHAIPEIVRKVEAYLKGDSIIFQLTDLGGVNLPPGFQGNVLSQTLKIPRGMTCTYGGLAAKAGHPKAARAVGTVMAENPFPLVIPCHRVIRADGAIGSYGGGETMKRKLLVMEGVTFDHSGRVASRHFFH